jgi:hypothetical protein
VEDIIGAPNSRQVKRERSTQAEMDANPMNE